MLPSDFVSIDMLFHRLGVRFLDLVVIKKVKLYLSGDLNIHMNGDYAESLLPFQEQTVSKMLCEHPHEFLVNRQTCWIYLFEM